MVEHITNQHKKAQPRVRPQVCARFSTFHSPRYQAFPLISYHFFFSSSQVPNYINLLVLIKANIAKFCIKQSAPPFPHGGSKKFPLVPQWSCFPREEAEIARTNERSILELLPARSGKKRIKTALFLPLCRSPTRGAFGNYSTFSLSLSLSLCFSFSGELSFSLLCSTPRNAPY